MGLGTVVRIMEQHFTTSSICKVFKVSHQTAKNWAMEFAPYLSETAKVRAGRKRVFTVPDMTVFALLAEYHQMGFRYDEAHAALIAGKRGVIPERSDVPIVPQALLVQLRDEIAARDGLIASLTTQRDKEQGRVELLEKQLEQKDAKIEQLMEAVAELKVQVKSSKKS